MVTLLVLVIDEIIIFDFLKGNGDFINLHEEEVLANVQNPDKFYEAILVPLKVFMAMEHVTKKSFSFDIKILCQTLWMLFFSKWWPIEKHPAVSNLRKNLRGYSQQGTIN